MVSFTQSSETAEQQVDGGVDRRLDAVFCLTSQRVDLHHVHPWQQPWEHRCVSSTSAPLTQQRFVMTDKQTCATVVPSPWIWPCGQVVSDTGGQWRFSGTCLTQVFRDVHSLSIGQSSSNRRPRCWGNGRIDGVYVVAEVDWLLRSGEIRILQLKKQLKTSIKILILSSLLPIVMWHLWLFSK